MPATIGGTVADAWERALALSAYGADTLTVGWWRGAAFVRLWNFRTGNNEWRRLPSRDVAAGSEPKPCGRSIFEYSMPTSRMGW